MSLTCKTFCCLLNSESQGWKAYLSRYGVRAWMDYQSVVVNIEETWIPITNYGVQFLKLSDISLNALKLCWQCYWDTSIWAHIFIPVCLKRPKLKDKYNTAHKVKLLFNPFHLQSSEKGTERIQKGCVCEQNNTACRPFFLYSIINQMKVETKSWRPPTICVSSSCTTGAAG